MATIMSRLLDHLSRASFDPNQEDLIVLPRYWNWLHKLGPLWTRRERCADCGWDSNPQHLLKVSNTGEERPKILFSRSEGLFCLSCDIESRLLGSLPDLDLNRWALSHWINQDKPCVRLDDASFEEEDVEWNFFIPERRGRPYSGIPQGCLVSGNTESEAAFDWVRRQLNTCLKSHSRCRTGTGSFIPTRLVSIGSANDQLKLVDKVEVPKGSHYIALSHCWGKKLPECLTTRSNLADQQRGIPWMSLPKTFQHAVSFTRRMGIKYIWIDSLCIIQRDREDWLREAGQMFHVYRHAHLTLGAAHAADSSGGLYSSLAPGRQLRLASLRNGRRTSELDAQQSFRDTTNLYLLEKSEPLFKRAWTFQERLVSPRMLYFTADELIWECYDMTVCECGFHCQGSYSTMSSKISYMNSISGVLPQRRRPRGEYIWYIRKVLIPRLVKRQRLLAAESEKTWRRLVYFYTDLGLTNETDRLLAIGALAEQTQAVRRKQRYLAGLWSGSLIADLLWSSTISRLGTPAASTPSWSWAPVCSPVIYNFVYSIKPSVEVLEADCEYVDGNPYGMAIAGRLVLRGRSIICTLRRVPGHPHPSFHLQHPSLDVYVEIRIDWYERRQSREDPQTALDEDIVEEVHVLQAAETCEFPAPISLILQEQGIETGGMFLRKGLVSPPGTRIEDQKDRLKLNKWYDNCSTIRTYTIA